MKKQMTLKIFYSFWHLTNSLFYLLISDETYILNKNRQTKLRRSAALLSEQDVVKFNNFTVERMETTVDQQRLSMWYSRLFTELRNLSQSSDIFNVRRGG
jgi:hypothetical protein